jgi:biopolymer transport protein ExbB
LVAIPALVAYRYLRGRVDGLVVEMEKQAIALADAVETAGPRPPVRGRGKSAA